MVPEHRENEKDKAGIGKRADGNENQSRRLGKTEKYRGKDIYTHVVFAERILDLVKQVKIKTMTTLGLFTLRDNLPEVLHEKVSENQLSWILFVNVINSVELGHIREEVRKHKE